MSFEKKIQELKNKIESAAYTAKRREQLLTDPNKFTDKCAPGFRVYWTGTSQTVMSWVSGTFSGRDREGFNRESYPGPGSENPGKINSRSAYFE